MAILHAASVGAILPPPGLKAYRAWSTGAVAVAEIPTSGWGSSDLPGANDALWKALAAGTFEVVIESVMCRLANTRVAITELHADAQSVLFDSVGTFPMHYPGLGIAMRDGFSFTMTGGGAMIQFRIHKYGPTYT